MTGLIILAIFFPITFMSVRYSKMVPHISIESNTAMSCFIGYAFGPGAGFLYGNIVGGACYIMNSFISPTYMSNVFFAGLAGAITALLKEYLGAGYITAVTIAMIIRTAIAFPYFLMFVAPIESFTHQVTRLFFDLMVYLPILSALLNIVSPFI